jgi:hypothetical protein
MLNIITDFKAFPNTVRKGIIFTIGGWVLFNFVTYKYLLPGEIPHRFIIIGVITSFILVQGYKVGRIFGILGNVMAFIYSCFFILLPSDSVPISLYALGLAAIFFAASTWFLFVKKSSDFFKNYRQSGKKQV